MEIKKCILVPDDFTEVATNAIAYAAIIAKKDNDKITLFHVINDESRAELKKQNKGLETLLTVMDERSKMYASKYNVEIDFVMKEGSIFTTIGEEASELNASLIVMGTHGVKGMQHLTGARALKVVGSSKMPVIIVQHKAPVHEGYDTIVVPVDDTFETKQKTLQTITFAKIFGSKVVLYKQHSNDEEKSNHIRNNANFMARQLEGHEVQFEIAEQESKSDFSDDFVKYAKKVNADLIIMLTTLDKDLKDLILGPAEQQVINNAEQIPVMCVNPMQSVFSTRSLSSVILYS